MRFDNMKCVLRGTLLAMTATASLLAQRADVRTVGSAYSTIDQSGAYVLSASIFAGTGSDGITISGSGVTLDLNGQEILCPGNRGVAIRINNAQNVVVRNGHISNCAMGIIVNGSANVKLEGLVIRGIDSAPPETGIMVVQSRNVVITGNMILNTGLGMFIRGSRSFGNRIENNTITGGTNAGLGICYNPTDTDRIGPQGDLIKGNLIRGFGIPVSITSTANFNVIQGNTLIYGAMAIRSDSKTTVDMDNIKVSAVPAI